MFLRRRLSFIDLCSLADVRSPLRPYSPTLVSNSQFPPLEVLADAGKFGRLDD